MGVVVNSQVPSKIDILKTQAARQAVDFIESGMVIGLGTGSTARFAVDYLGEKIKHGLLTDIIAIPTSNATARQAESWHIALGELAQFNQLDLAIDGADEIGPNLNLLKGWGGALVREKLVEIYAQRLIIIADGSKVVDRLCTRGPLPVEVTQFAWEAQAKWLAQGLNCRVSRREEGDGNPFYTDNHNFILNCHFANGLLNPHDIERKLAGRPGIVGHGLFLDMPTEAIIATETGVQHLRGGRV